LGLYPKGRGMLPEMGAGGKGCERQTRTCTPPNTARPDCHSPLS